MAYPTGVHLPFARGLCHDSVEHGFARLTPDPVDGRRSVVELSASGRRMLEAAHESRRAAVTQALAAFSPDEIETFATLLDRFVAAWPRE
jgi:DNA-binding MarR family transcriptional regulator